LERGGVDIVLNIPPEASTAFAEVQPTELHRILSNLVDNSVESFDRDGKVELTVSVRDGRALISVIDNGKGIPPEVLLKLGKKGITFGKTGGNGLGISHANLTVESWSGTLRIESKIATGTTVTLTLPLADTPRWFPREIKISPGMTVVVIDDDLSIHQIWKQRFAELIENGRVQPVHLYSPGDFLEWYRENVGMESVLYLCDYEFMRSNQTGIDLIEMANVARDAILVTSHWDERPIRDRCKKIGLRLLPKVLAGTITLVSVDTKNDSRG
jgi:hypothetical protein